MGIVRDVRESEAESESESETEPGDHGPPKCL